MAKILVIDDDRSICESLELYLSEEGYQCQTALTGTDGLNKYVQVQPDLVILDIRLPDIDGFTVLEEIREDDEDAKVIMITAFHDMDTTIRAMKAGAFDQAWCIAAALAFLLLVATLPTSIAPMGIAVALCVALTAVVWTLRRGGWALPRWRRWRCRRRNWQRLPRSSARTPG